MGSDAETQSPNTRQSLGRPAEEGEEGWEEAEGKGTLKEHDPKNLLTWTCWFPHTSGNILESDLGPVRICYG